MPRVTVITVPTETTVQASVPKPTVRPARKIAWSKLLFLVRNGAAALLSPANLPLNLVAFLLGRVSIMGEIAPLGLAFFAAVLQVARPRSGAAGLWAIAGVLSIGHYTETFVYIWSIAVCFRLADKLSSMHRKLKAVPLLMFAAVLLSGLAFIVWPHATMYNMMLILFDATLCMVLAYIFTYGVPVVTEFSAEKQINGETMIGVVALLAAAVAGLGDFSVLGYSVRNIVGNLLIMLLALSGGAGVGASIGVVIGLVVGLTDGNAPFAISLYALAGLLAGTFRVLGRFAVILGFILGTVITVLYVGQASNFAVILAEVGIAAAVNLAISFSKFSSWSEKVYFEPKAVSSEQALAMVREKLGNVAGIFNDLAAVFGSSLVDTKDKIREEELARMLSAVGEQVCERCEKRPQCWEHNFYRTYQAVLDILGLAEGTSLTAANIPKIFKETCIKQRELVETVNMVAEQNRAYLMWQRRISNSRQMVGEQLKAAGNIIDSLAGEIRQEPADNHELACSLQEMSAKLACPLTKVRVTGTQGATAVEIQKNPCSGNRECMNTILPLASKLLREKVVLHAECGSKLRNRECKINMRVVQRYGVETGMAYSAKEPDGICGDTCSVVPVTGGRLALMISDGMGSGRRAAKESTLTVDFLAKLLTAGFDANVAIQTVNSMLMLRRPDETFSTVDMAIIDTHSGGAEFLKIGAAPSFIKRVCEVTTINSASLPIGILHQVEIEPVQWSLAPGDIVVMVSDGIVDLPHRGLAKEHWIANYLRRITNYTPQEIADMILGQALEMTGKHQRDDMTVLVAKVVEHPGLLH